MKTTYIKTTFSPQNSIRLVHDDWGRVVTLAEGILDMAAAYYVEQWNGFRWVSHPERYDNLSDASIAFGRAAIRARVPKVEITAANQPTVERKVA